MEDFSHFGCENSQHYCECARPRPCAVGSALLGAEPGRPLGEPGPLLGLGVLLDIQRHFDVSDSRIGLLQTAITRLIRSRELEEVVGEEGEEGVGEEGEEVVGDNQA
ncbi:unnamed protein product [Boreogadus saida]